MEGQEKIFRVIEFILLLNSGLGYRKNTLMEALDISESTFKRYIDNLRTCGFDVEKIKGKYYRINPECSMLKQITASLLFSGRQRELLSQTIEFTDASEEEKQELISKISQINEVDPFIKYDELRITRYLRNAMANKEQVCLQDYSSSHSSTIKDRLTEPFTFVKGFKAIWCYDVEENKNKIFKISRIADVNFIGQKWLNEKNHKALKTDIFGLSGHSLIPVSVKLTLRAKNLLLEETLANEKNFEPFDNKSFLLNTFVAHFEGITRFVLGLPGETEIISPPELENFIAEKRNVYTKQVRY